MAAPWTESGGFALALALAFVVPPAYAAPIVEAAAPAPKLSVLKGRSELLRAGGKLVRVAISDPKVMDVRVVGTDQLLVQGLRPGTSTLMLWTANQPPKRYEVAVGLDAAAVEREVRHATGNAGLRVSYTGHAFLLAGQARSTGERELAETVAKAFGAPVVNVVQGPATGEQVAIDVHVVELARSASLNLGVNVGGGEVTDVVNGVRKYVFKPGEIMAGATGVDPSTLSALDFLALKLQALQARGEAKLLAHPTLVTSDGGTAKFLAGGEIPVPIPQALGMTTITWKEFGVRLEVQPSIRADGRIALAVKPEVSSLDYANGIKQANAAIPALRTRRAETTVQLAPGETLMLGGLISHEQDRGLELLPGIGDIPVLGELFRSRRFRDNDSELAILVTPRLLGAGTGGKLPGALPGVKAELEGAR